MRNKLFDAGADQNYDDNDYENSGIDEGDNSPEHKRRNMEIMVELPKCIGC